MCGIAGLVDHKRQLDGNELALQAKRMADALHHRGPDTGGQWTDVPNGLALSFRRLSIIDLTQSGHQPMQSASRRFSIVYNGEVYNHQELRKQLIELGCSFRGTSDTEVILEAFEYWGIETTVSRLIGMFAIALWDNEEHKLWLIRDRLGIKPLYFGSVGGRFLFASELKAMRAIDGWVPEIDRDALAGFLRFNYIPAPRSIYKDIYKLPPGSLLSLRPGGDPDVKRYWTMADVIRQGRVDASDDQIVDAAETLMRDAIRRRMVADVPLGALLSGGLDSATVAALMQAESEAPIRTFTIGFENAEYDEAEDARAVANHIGSDHTELYLSANRARDIIPHLPDLYDEPFADSSALPTRLVSQLAKKDVTVALSGDGGDEVFFGYNRYIAAEDAWRRMASMSGWQRRLFSAAAESLSIGTWDRLARLLPTAQRPRMPGEKLHKLATVFRQPDENAIYRRLVSQWDDPAAFLSAGEETLGEAWRTSEELADFAERMAFLDTVTYLPDDILTKVDRASMSVSLEVRVPLLDHRLIEFAWTLPKRMRIRGSTTKWVLRQVCYRHVPQAIVERPKMGFAIPLASWLQGPLYEWADSLLDEKRLEEGGLFEPAVVRGAWEAFLDGKGNNHHGIWGLLQAQAWLEHWA
ncbi:MAG: Asparagine synthetase [glutamine-hydrolyzing] 1 [Alphaproteobacteria bacterium MarineAlpha4_Bin2]|nr:MAG: Asparagine synthetase [glutamine-hydrolyzing] 1 [Alphaproteobacteria bacterium MarineAlpha4_Bin2]